MKRILLIFLFVFCIFAEEKSEAKPFVLSLSGGGARGLAHIGVLKYFEENGIVPDTIVGTSMGAIVGTLYACGYSTDEIYRILKPLSTGVLLYGNANSKSLRNKRQRSVVTLRFDKNFGVALPKSIASPQALDGVMGTSVIAAQMSSGGDFDKLPIPLRIFTTNLSMGNFQMHKDGDILQIVKASSAAPGLMPPVRIGNDWHIDGGLRANIPLLDNKKHNDYFVFAVDVSSDKTQSPNRLNSMVDVILLAVEMGMKDAETKNAGLADIVISPLNDEIKNTDFYMFDKLVEMGYVSAKIAIENSPEVQSYKNSGRVITAPPSEFNVDVIEMYGLQKVKDWYLRNILNMNLEKPITEERIARLTRIAEATDFFESFHITGHDDTLTAVVLEKERRSIDFGIRFDNHNLAEVLAAPRYSNIGGYGISVGGNFQIGFLRKKILGEIIWMLPIRQSFNWYIDFNGYISSQRLVSRQIDDSTYIDVDKEIINYSESDITKNGVRLISGFELANSIAFFGGFRSEKYKSRQSQDNDVIFDFAEGQNRIKMLLTGVEADYRDDAYFPSFGGRHRFWLSGASSEWGSKDRFFTINGYSSFVIPINNAHVLIPHIHGTWADQELPSAMRYYIGGGRFEDFASYSNVLYTIPFAGVENRGLFADNFAMFGLSWRYQLTQSQPLFFQFYVDCGNLWNYDQDDKISDISKEFWDNIPVGLEAELAYRTPVGPIRFSWSRLVRGEFSENFGLERKNVFRFSAGFDF